MAAGGFVDADAFKSRLATSRRSHGLIQLLTLTIMVRPGAGRARGDGVRRRVAPRATHPPRPLTGSRGCLCPRQPAKASQVHCTHHAARLSRPRRPRSHLLAGHCRLPPPLSRPRRGAPQLAGPPSQHSGQNHPPSRHRERDIWVRCADARPPATPLSLTRSHTTRPRVWLIKPAAPHSVMVGIVVLLATGLASTVFGHCARHRWRHAMDRVGAQQQIVYEGVRREEPGW